MIMKFATVLAGLAALALSGTAHAQMVRPQSPASVVKAMQDAGYRAELTKDDTGDPMIRSTSEGTTFAIFFYGCTENTDCRTLQFYAGYSDPTNASLADMNKWNTENRFGRAYVTDEGGARVEMDVDLDDGGISALLFQDNLEFWVLTMSKFEEFIYQ